MINILYITEGIILSYLAVNVVYVLFFSVASLFSKKRIYSHNEKKNRFVVLIPAYEGDEVILKTAEASLLQQYPKEYYDLVVIADSLQPGTIEKLRQLQVQVVEVAFENSTKSKSLNAALDVIRDKPYDYAVILDIDNIMSVDFLERVNDAVFDNKIIVQGHRQAKNLDTSFAIMDGISEEINNTLFRKGHQAVGLSSALIGSGKAIQFDYFKQLMQQITAVGGFDKEMELKLLVKKVPIYYLEDAIVLDEKVQSARVFQNQRKRWLSAQVHYLRAYFPDGVLHLFRHGNIDYFNKVLQFVLLPRILLLGILFLASVLDALGLLVPHNTWIILFCVTLISLLICVPSVYWNRNSFMALLSLPKVFLIMFRNLFFLKGANRKFIHTPHSS